MKIKNVLSLFDGCSCLQVALGYAGIEYENYYASEVDKHAIKITQKNYPDTFQLGDVHFVSQERLPKIDLLCGGSPCQDLSIAGKQKGLKGSRSALFWEYIRVLRETKPRWFILENVASMKKVDRDVITKEMGVEPILINSSLTSAQNRRRLYWANIPVQQPEDQVIYLKDILEPIENIDERLKIRDKSKTIRVGGRGSPIGSKQEWDSLFKVAYLGTDSQSRRVYSPNGKSVCLSANGGGGGAKTGLYEIASDFRRLSAVECERLMSLPDNYTEHPDVSPTQRYKMCGNGFEARAVAHILCGIKGGV